MHSAEPCPVTAPSRAIEGHTHTCSGTHQDGMHKCAVMVCRRWFGGRRDAALCLNWQTSWPHAVPNIRALNTTDDPAEVTCDACLWALGSQQQEPTREQQVEAAEDRAEQAAYDAARERRHG